MYITSPQFILTKYQFFAVRKSDGRVSKYTWFWSDIWPAPTANATPPTFMWQFEGK